MAQNEEAQKVTTSWKPLRATQNLKIDFTGGISSDGDIGKAYEYGADYITASSIAITDPELFASWIVSYGREKITLGADVTDIKTKTIAFRGWQKKSEIHLFDHLEYFYEPRA